MSVHREPAYITGYTSQQASSGTATFTNSSSAQPHGSPGPHDKAAGYLKSGEPGGIDPAFPSEAGGNITVKGDTPAPPRNPYGDPTNILGPMSKHGWTSQGH